MKKKYIIILIVVLALLNIFQLIWTLFSYPLFTDAVPDEETAIAIAIAVLPNMYGQGVLKQESYLARYNSIGGYWEVFGTGIPGHFSGAPEIRIRKSDGKILRVRHSM